MHQHVDVSEQIIEHPPIPTASTVSATPSATASVRPHLSALNTVNQDDQPALSAHLREQGVPPCTKSEPVAQAVIEQICPDCFRFAVCGLRFAVCGLGTEEDGRRRKDWEEEMEKEMEEEMEKR